MHRTQGKEDDRKGEAKGMQQGKGMTTIHTMHARYHVHTKAIHTAIGKQSERKASGKAGRLGREKNKGQENQEIPRIPNQ
jgi:hypothetical protein